jgi:hypothetical protein
MMERASEHCVLLDVEEQVKLRKSRMLVSRQSYLFELEPINAHSVDEMRILF